MKNLFCGILVLLCVFSLFNCQSSPNVTQQTTASTGTNDSNNNNSLAETKWGDNPSLYYMFFNNNTYKYCLFSPNNNPDEGTYSLNGNIVTFNSTKLGESWTATIDGNTMTRETGEKIYKQ